MKTLNFDLQAQELIRANQIIEQFINSCSHSMRGPLKSITGLLSLLNPGNECVQNGQEKIIELIAGSVEKMETMLDQLEYFLQNATRKIVAKPVVDLKKMVSTLIKKHHTAITDAGIKMKLTVKQSAPVSIDLSRLKLILDHLLQNAIHFHDSTRQQPGIHIIVNSSAKKLSFSFRDNGVGIDPVHHLKIFDLFYRANNKSTGSGMGLYVVKQIVKKMGATINVKCGPGGGTIFTFAMDTTAQPKS